jgi:hypothetical protein
MTNLDWMDPMLLFTRIFAQAAILSLRKMTQLIAWQANDYGDMLAQGEEKASVAAEEIARLSQYLSQLNFLKVFPGSLLFDWGFFLTVFESTIDSPFYIYPSFPWWEFFLHQKGADMTFDSNFLEVSQALQELKDIDLLCQAGLEFIDTVTSYSPLNKRIEQLGMLEL